MPKILLVEDDLDLADVLEIALTSEGHDVERTHDYAQTAQQLQRKNYAAVILDASMRAGPAGDLVELAKTNVVLISGRFDQMTNSETSSQDVCARLAKPFDIDKFIEAVSSACQ